MPLTEEQARLYQSGEVIPAEGVKGYVLPTLEGLPLGFGKVSDKFIEKLFTKEGESVEDAKKRLSGEK